MVERADDGVDVEGLAQAREQTVFLALLVRAFFNDLPTGGLVDEHEDYKAIGHAKIKQIASCGHAPARAIGANVIESSERVISPKLKVYDVYYSSGSCAPRICCALGEPAGIISRPSHSGQAV